jgi:DNA polymerase I
MRKATELLTELKNRMSVIEDELQETFPPIVTERWSEKTGKRLKDNVEVFNVGSRQQVAKRLESLGVKWKRVTETGSSRYAVCFCSR